MGCSGVCSTKKSKKKAAQKEYKKKKEEQQKKYTKKDWEENMGRYLCYIEDIRKGGKTEEKKSRSQEKS